MEEEGEDDDEEDIYENHPDEHHQQSQLLSKAKYFYSFLKRPENVYFSKTILLHLDATHFKFQTYIFPARKSFYCGHKSIEKWSKYFQISKVYY